MVKIQNILSIQQTFDRITHFQALVDRADGVYHDLRNGNGESLIANIPVSQNGKKVFVKNLAQLLEETQISRGIGGFVVLLDKEGALLRYGAGVAKQTKYDPQTKIVAVQPILPVDDHRLIDYVRSKRKDKGRYDLERAHSI